MIARRLILLAATGAMTAGPLAAQEATDVAPVEVIGTRAPPAEAPRSATCEYYIRKDPALRAWMAIMSDGDPFPESFSEGRIGPPPISLAVGPPLFYLPTRLPRDPDLKSPPKSAPGSARPDIGGKRWLTREPEVFATGPALSREPGLFSDLPTGEGNEDVQSGVIPPDDIAVGVDTCRQLFSRDAQQGGGGPAADAFRRDRARIAARDKTLPMGFALYDDGRFEEALAEFKLAYKKLPDADGGDEAGLMIGKIYLLALREKNDPQEAVVWLKKVAGGLFDPTTMTPQFDPKAPERNTALGEAAMLLGGVYLKGAGPVAKDPQEARKWYERAFDVGHVAAAKIVGDMAYNGVGGPRDLKRAFKWYARGARYGHAPSQFALARMYETGEAGKVDLKLAAIWYNEAAKIDYPPALYALAYAYDRGAGVKADPGRAMGLYKTAALAGDAGAQAALASYFYTGEGVAKDHKAARLWFDAAARGGDPEAAFSLAAMMIRGEGGEVDRVRAWSWLHVAEIEQHPKAAQARAVLEAKMTPEEKKAAAALVGAAA
jgi:TPR repeat protein